MKAKRNYKDGIFRSLFNDKKALLELYNALSGSEYPENTEIQIVTLDNIIFNGIKNDLAFIIDNRFVVLTEQQSTMSPNFPLRLFCYLAKVYEKIAESKDVYSTKRIELPAPELYVFYNGLADEPLEQIMKLSDSFKEKNDIITVEAIVKIINVNYEKGAELLKQCETLQKYSLFVHRVRELHAKYNDIDVAVAESVREFIENDILTDFLMEHRGDIMSVLEINLTQEEQIAIRLRDMREQVIKEVTEQVIKDVTEQVTKDVTEQVTKDVTEQVTKDVTDQVTKDVTEQVTKDVTEQVTKDVTRSLSTEITRKLKAEGIDINTISRSVGLSPDEIQQL